MSVPSASATQPVVAATAAPPEEPPGVRSRAQGLRVCPKSGERQNEECANSGVVVLPTTIAPAALRRRTITGSASGTQSAKQADPRVVRWPLMGVKSFKATGTPWRGARGLAARAGVVGRARGLHRLLRQHEGEGVEGGLHRLDPPQRGLHGVARRQAPRGDLGRERRGREGAGAAHGRRPRGAGRPRDRGGGPHCFSRVQIWS